MQPIVLYYTATGPVPAIVMKEVAPETLNLAVFKPMGQNVRLEYEERIKRSTAHARHTWDYLEEPKDNGTEEADLSDG